MKSSSLLVLCVAFVLISAIAECRPGRALHDSSDDPLAELTGSSGANVVSATSSAKAKNGRASVRVTATSEAVTEVQNSVAIVTSKAIAKLKSGEGDAKALAKASAESSAIAVAEAFTSVLIEIKSEGDENQACGSGFASAEAAATAYAVAISNAIAGAAIENNVSIAKADSKAIATATAKAFARSESIACVNGTGEAEAYQVSFASSIAKPYAKAFSAAYAEVTAKGANAIVKSDAESGAEEETFTEGQSGASVRGQGTAASKGESEAVTTKRPPCQSTPFQVCCFGRRFLEDCTCGTDTPFGGSQFGGLGNFGDVGFPGLSDSNSSPKCTATRMSRTRNTAIYENDADYTDPDEEKTYPKGYQCSC